MLVASSVFFSLLRFQQQMLHVIYKRMRDYTLLTAELHIGICIYVGMITDKRKCLNHSFFCSMHSDFLSVLLVFFLLTSVVGRNRRRLLFDQIEILSYHYRYWNAILCRMLNKMKTILQVQTKTRLSSGRQVDKYLDNMN